MLFKTCELVQWLGITVFEMCVYVAGLTIFTFILCIKIDLYYDISWWMTFLPLFIADTCNVYFCMIVFIRQYVDGLYKIAVMRGLWSLVVLTLIFVFKYLLCKKLSGTLNLDISEVMSPVFLMLQLIMIRACKLH